MAKFLCILSPSYSGSTLLSFLVSGHPQISTVGEMTGTTQRVNLESYQCSCGELLRECSFWRSVTQEMNRRGFPFDVANFGLAFKMGNNAFTRKIRSGSFHNGRLNRIRDRLVAHWPSHVRELQTLKNRNMAFIETILEISGTSTFVDASKELLRPKLLAEIPGLDVRTIILTRDVRGVANSYIKNAQQSPELGAKWWEQYYREVEQTYGDGNGQRLLSIRYEDLCNDTQNTLLQIQKFCGVEEIGAVTEFNRSKYHIVGNRMRLNFDNIITLDESWQTELSSTQLAAINRIAGERNRRLGYQ
jgi:hypothetical protein